MKLKLIGIFCLFLISLGKSAPVIEQDDGDERLPHTTHPTHYEITLWTPLDYVTSGDRSFDGLVKISILVDENTSEIKLHSKDMTVKDTEIKLTRGIAEIDILSVSDQAHDIIVLKTSIELKKDDQLTLEIPYSTKLQQNMAGFYQSSYKEEGTNEIRYLATTQFEATGARYAFICYDEPEFKATFQLNIHHNKTYTVISNTIGVFKADNDNNEAGMTEFAITPKMSSYLMAFIVSEFEYATNENTLTGTDIPHRVYARPEFKSKLDYSVDKSFELLNALEKFVDIKYEVTKMYSAAIPDFAAGAMENWGLIIYKEQYLILNEKSHHREKFDSIRVIAHELGHQFFGNYVTCKWWDETWLNEGFATLLEFLLVQEIYPEHRFSEFFNLLRLQSAFITDASETATHPMTFDGPQNSRIIYDKAGSVIRMFQHVLTDKMFRDALKAYLDDNNHMPVTADDLYKAFEKIITQNTAYEGFGSFTLAYSSWVLKSGHPIIHITTDDTEKKFKVTQERYFDATSKTQDDNDPNVWQIPLNFVTEDSPNFNLDQDQKAFDHFMTEKELGIDYPPSYSSDKWYIFNKQQIGYYRVNYEPKNWLQIVVHLNSDKFIDIHLMNRAQLIDDSMTLAFDGYLPYDFALGILQYLQQETDYMPWRAASAHLDKIDIMLKGSPLQDKFRRFVKKSLRRFSVANSFEKSSEHVQLVEQYATEFVADWNCRFQEHECLSKTEQLLTLEANGFKVPEPLQITVICNGLRTGNKTDEFQKIFRRLQVSHDQSERLRLIDGLLCSPDKKLLFAFLETTLIDSQEISYKRHEIDRILGNAYSRSEVGIEAVLEFFDVYYDDVIEVYSKGTMQSTLVSLSKRVTSESDRENLEKFLIKMGDKIDDSIQEQIVENFEFNVKWLADRTEKISSFLENYLLPIDKIEDQLRLPKTSEPVKYKVLLEVLNIQKGYTDFNGEVEVEVKLNEASRYIQMHSRGHAIEEYSVTEKNTGTIIEVLELSLFPQTDMLTIYFMSELPENFELIVKLKFKGQLLTGASGFYLTSYTTTDPETNRPMNRYLAATQFEPTRARHAFPNYDEPEYKAVFEIKILHEKDLTAIANMDGISTISGEYVLTTFEPTPIMSSYLNAFVISDLGKIEIAKTGETEHRIWVRPDSIDKASYALDHSVKALKALEEYTGFTYELKKVDSAGIPNKSGAMENWGMVTYRENAMIYDQNPENSPHSQRLSGVDVIAHELAHQFFGDAVTCKWWDQIWLNEGFATLFEYHLMGMIHPDWNVRHFFNKDTLHSAFKYDSELRRPMTHDVETLDEISNVFDSIAYAKSGSVLRMFQNAVGDKTFQESLKLYLEKNNHKQVTSQHLVDAIEETMLKNEEDLFKFGEVFRTWETQGGYPYIEVVFESGKFNVKQHRYLTHRASTDQSSWHIPLNFATKSHPDFEDTSISHIYPQDEVIFSIDAPSDHSESDWYVFNLQQLGYYRVNYDLKNWRELVKVLNSDDFDKIHVLNRAQLLDDAINFALGDYLGYDILIQLMGYLNLETEYTPFAVADQILSDLYSTFGPWNDNINKFIYHISENLYDTWKLPTNGMIPVESVYDRYNREIAMKFACNGGNIKCLADTFNLDKQWIANPSSIPRGLENVFMCNGLRGIGKQTEFIQLFRTMQDSRDSTMRNLLINALSCSNDENALFNLMEASLGDGQNVNFNQAERRLIFTSVLTRSRSGLPAAIRYMDEYELDIILRLGYGNLEGLLSVVAKEVKIESQRDIFGIYLNSLDHLEASNKTNIVKIVNDNFLLQQQVKYNVMMTGILRILDENAVVIPTEEPTLEPSSTTQQSTVPDSTTQASTTTGATQSSSSSTQSSTTQQSTNPTSTPGPADESTTQGASTIHFNFILALFTVLMILKNNY